ncbi:PAS domain-containing protein [Erythrobacter sp. NE805]|uniref:PAS domain-containing protein n=1 Tax=Erythrobacter sp. NE805 TaxID=3389875 RepID=UPI00396B3123
MTEPPDADAATGGLASPDRRLQAVLDNASLAIFLMDDRQHCIYMNAAAEQLTGYTLGEILAADRPLHDIVHHTRPDGRPFPLAECAIDRAFPEHNQMRGEEMFVHREGHFYPVAFCASPVRNDASQTIGTVIEVRDITRERRAEAMRRALVDELDQRRGVHDPPRRHPRVTAPLPDQNGNKVALFSPRASHDTPGANPEGGGNPWPSARPPSTISTTAASRTSST